MDTDILENVWPEWKIEKQLGKGSYGVVYKAARRDHNVESLAAIKVITIPSDVSEVDSLRSEGLDLDATRTYFRELVNDFVNEIQIMETLKGIQNIVSVEDYKVVEKQEELGWAIYIRMELLTPLNVYISDKKLTEKEVRKFGVDICTALEICNRRDIIHRDIKPENIFVNAFGHFKLGDFGIARKLENITGGLSQKGTYNYMAPEVANGTDYDARVDIYSLGIALYRLLNNNHFPFLDREDQLSNPNERRIALERRIRGEELPPPCDASPAMANLILRACQFNPDRRFRTATEMKEALISLEKGIYRVVELESDKTEVAKPSANFDRELPVQREGERMTETEETPEKVSKVKKKRKGKRIFAVVIVIGILVGSGVYFAPELLDIYLQVSSHAIHVDSDNESNKDNEEEEESGMDSLSDEVAGIIDEAGGMAEVGDYENALDKVQAGLITYPKSKVLQDKEKEYLEAIDEQIKKDMLSQAAELAGVDDYGAAVDLLEEKLEAYQDDGEYLKAYDTYRQAYAAQVKSEASAEADTLAGQKDYLGAMQAIEKVISAVGEDEGMKRKLLSYEEAYVTEQLALVDASMESQDYEAAEKILDAAIKELPQNQELHEKWAEVEESKPKFFLDVCRPYEWSEYNYREPDQIVMSGISYTKGFVLGGDSIGDPFALFNLRGKYESMTFTLGHVDGSTLNNGVVNIYLDEQLVESIKLECESLPQEYTISLEGASKLKIAQTEYYAWSKYGFGNVIVQ